ncbi:Phage minor structural protein GP20 [Clostridium liquoris]|jgi:hypothetical protein|uniref:Phage minor structural protein GP20 n=1 Tax=Clostridium liquoris TaxID=1289519 RepID=A0A2T0B1M2_9CLOT|nr:phage scaffolding protein [Clostridium liquoris]PRR77685.1 Phage minor structural protein GP20 [Clostridium liquoris]
MPKLNEILGESFKQIPEDLQKKYKDVDLVDSSNYVEKKDLETANNSIKEYKKKNEDTTKEYENKLTKLNFDTKFEKAVVGYKAKNLKALRALLDMDKVKLVDDTFIGLDEQVKTLKESDPYLFEEETPGGTGNIGGDPSYIIDTDEGKLSLGARLAKERTEASKVTEAQNKFFS